MTDSFSQIKPEDTPLYVGKGVRLEGRVIHEGPREERAVILGTLSGDIEWNGTVQVPQGGMIAPNSRIKCRELIVAGEVMGDEVVIEANLLRVKSTAVIRVSEINVPSGGLENEIGSKINGRLNMDAEQAFKDADAPSAAKPKAYTAPAPSSLAMPFTASNFTGAASRLPSGGADVDLVVESEPIYAHSAAN